MCKYFKYFNIFLLILTSLSDDCRVKICKFTALSSGSFCQIYRITDQALIAETAVWPNFFLINVFLALKGSQLFIITHTVLEPLFMGIKFFHLFFFKPCNKRLFQLLTTIFVTDVFFLPFPTIFTLVH